MKTEDMSILEKGEPVLKERLAFLEKSIAIMQARLALNEKELRYLTIKAVGDREFRESEDYRERLANLTQAVKADTEQLDEFIAGHKRLSYGRDK